MDSLGILLGFATSDVRTDAPRRVTSLGSRPPAVSVENNWLDICMQRQRIGDAGEQFVMELERNELRKNKRIDLAERVAKVPDGMGFDISSFSPDGSTRNIEVKTTAGPDTEPFYITANEVACSQQFPNEFVLYRVYDFYGDARLYELHGDLTKVLDLIPSVYKAAPSSN